MADNLTRRGFLGHAAGAAIAVAMCEQAFSADAAGASAPELARLIADCEETASAWVEAFDAAYRSTDPALAMREEETSAAMRAAQMALLYYRPQSLSEVSNRFRYLLSHNGPWGGVVPEEWELDALFASMMDRRA